MPASADEKSVNQVAEWIAAARAGSSNALGLLLDLCRHYLLKVSNAELGADLHGKAGPSDLVQLTFEQAIRIINRFEGNTEQELLQWLRAILKKKAKELRRHYRAQKRHVRREGGVVPEHCPANTSTPSKIVSRDEEARTVAAAVARLPEHYRQVIVWREWEDVPLEEIARRLDRSTDAARMLWVRALEVLAKELDIPS
jgi:RNA polymerase sigma-70 factor (ECF subfamily)